MKLKIILHCPESVSIPTFLSLEKLRRTGLDYGCDIIAGIGYARQAMSIALTKNLLKPESEYFLIMDSNMMFEPGDVENLLEDLTRSAAIVGGLDISNLATKYLSNSGFRFPLKSYLRPAGYIAPDFMGIRRDIVEKIVRVLDMPLVDQHSNFINRYTLFESEADKPNGENTMIPDNDFCNKARRAGAKIYLDTRIRVAHFKQDQGIESYYSYVDQRR